MLKRLSLYLGLLLSLPVSGAALLKPHKLSSWGILPANYSGITPFGAGRYAVVSDKEPLDGFYVWYIQQNPLTGDILQIINHGFAGQVPLDTNTEGISLRDSEDIIYCPQRQSFFVCGEGYQDIIEMNMEGQRTGYELSVPDYLRNIYPNYGFEALAYDSVLQTFYTTTENALPADSPSTSYLYRQPVTLHIQTFQGISEPGRLIFPPSHEYLYELDMPRATRMGRQYAHGVVAMTALGEGRLAVLEREAFVSQAFVGSWVYNKLYIVDTRQAPGSMLQKQFVAEWDTHLRVANHNWANYEGMCLGAPLSDGRQTLILISDSQGGYGIDPVHLNDYIRVIVL